MIIFMLALALLCVGFLVIDQIVLRRELLTSSKSSWMEKAGQNVSTMPNKPLTNTLKQRKVSDMDGKDIKIYRYMRGDTYSCLVTLINKEHVIHSEIKYPATASTKVIDKLMDDAERAALKKYEEKK